MIEFDQLGFEPKKLVITGYGSIIDEDSEVKAMRSDKREIRNKLLGSQESYRSDKEILKDQCGR